MENYVVAGTMLIGLVNVAQMVIDRKWNSFIKAMTAVIAGGVFGYLKFFGLPSIEIGIMVGLSSSGIFKVAQVLGVKPTGQPNV